MCGLFGWVREGGKTGGRSAGMLALALALANDSRGGHSWGFYARGVGRRARGRVRKGVGPSSTMGRENINAAGSAAALIGHTRRATTGRVTPRNAHPWHRSGVVWAHNGIVSNHDTLTDRYPGRACEVDSEHFGEHLSAGACLSELSAYGALTYSRDADPGAVYLGTFHGGELDVRKVPGFGVVWSSESDHLSDSLALAGLPDGRSYRIDDGTLYRVPPAGGGLYLTGRLPVSPPSWHSDRLRAFTAGRGDDTEGDPFAADGGDLTDAELEAAGLSREDIDRYGLSVADVRNMLADDATADAAPSAF